MQKRWIVKEDKGIKSPCKWGVWDRLWECFEDDERHHSRDDAKSEATKLNKTKLLFAKRFSE